MVTVLVVFAVWFTVAIPVAFIVGRVFAKREAARRGRYIPPPPRPHP